MTKSSREIRLPVTAAAERGDKITAEYIPPPPPPPGKIWVRAPLDGRGHPEFPDLHLSPDSAAHLRDQLTAALDDYMTYSEDG